MKLMSALNMRRNPFPVQNNQHAARENLLLKQEVVSNRSVMEALTIIHLVKADTC